MFFEIYLLENRVYIVFLIKWKNGVFDFIHFPNMYKHIISTSVESEYTDACLYNFQQLEEFNNSWNWPYSVNNYGIICVLMVLQKIMGCVVFNLIPNLYKSYKIWSIKRIRRIKDRFMRVDRQILDVALETFETSKSRCGSFGSQAAVCVDNTNSSHNNNVMYSSKSMFKFTTVFKLCIMKGIYC